MVGTDGAGRLREEEEADEFDEDEKAGCVRKPRSGLEVAESRCLDDIEVTLEVS